MNNPIANSGACVTLLCFAKAKDITGKGQLEFPLQGKMTLKDLIARIVEQFPRLSSVIPTSMFSLNLEYVDASSYHATVLHNLDEIALIPPVSGG